jgi:hypothetical protein
MCPTIQVSQLCASARGLAYEVSQRVRLYLTIIQEYIDT